MIHDKPWVAWHDGSCRRSGSHVPDILYSPVSLERRLLMLNAAEEALEPTVSTRSKPGGVLSGGSMLKGGRKPSSA